MQFLWDYTHEEKLDFITFMVYNQKKTAIFAEK